MRPLIGAGVAGFNSPTSNKECKGLATVKFRSLGYRTLIYSAHLSAYPKHWALFGLKSFPAQGTMACPARASMSAIFVLSAETSARIQIVVVWCRALAESWPPALRPSVCRLPSAAAPRMLVLGGQHRIWPARPLIPPHPPPPHTSLHPQVFSDHAARFASLKLRKLAAQAINLKRCCVPNSKTDAQISRCLNPKP